MVRKFLVLLTVLVVASLGFASMASADTSDGRGTLEAQGDGFAGLQGDGWVRVRGNGVLWVKGAEHIAVEGRGIKKEFEDGWTLYIGFHGMAQILGRNVSVLMAGESVELYAVGSGRVILWGKGTYEVNGLPTGVWSGIGHIISY